MINSQYVTNALYGAYRLARGDKTGLFYFDTSIAGFWRSFFAAVLIAPLFLILLIIRFSVDDIGTGAVRFYTIEAIAYVIGWVLFPVVVFYLVQTLEKEEQYVGFIVAYNWAAVLQNSLYLPFAILFQLGMIPGEAAGILNLILLGLVLAYTWFVAKTALDISGAVAGGIIILDVGLWVSLTVITESFLKPTI
mgnify:FL=1